MEPLEPAPDETSVRPGHWLGLSRAVSLREARLRFAPTLKAVRPRAADGPRDPFPLHRNDKPAALGQTTNDQPPLTQVEEEPDHADTAPHCKPAAAAQD